MAVARICRQCASNLPFKQPRRSACEKGRSGEFFVALQFARDDFSGHMRFVPRFVRQHRLAHDIADGEDVWHIGAHLNIDVDKAPVRHGHAGFVGGNLFAIGAAAYCLQDHVINLGRGGRASGLGAFECDFNGGIEAQRTQNRFCLIAQGFPQIFGGKQS